MSLDFSSNGTSALTKGYTTHNVYDRELLKQKRFNLDAPNRDGIIEIRKKFPSNILKVKGRIEGTSYSNLETSIIPNFISFLYNDSDVQLIFSDKTDRYYNAQIDDFNYPEYYSAWRPMELYFLCNDPFAYSTTEETDTQSGITSNNTTFSITNNGHYYTFPTITITFNQSQTHVYVKNNSILGNRFDISKNFVTSDVLEIDCKNLTIKLNSSNSPAGLGDGGTGNAEMIALKAGLNTIQIGTDDASINMNIVTSWRKVYLS